jgi:carbon monoxide dehydrogenase subunit G
MELKGEYRVPAPRELVWAMLNDAAVLRECIPGCESLEGSPAEGFAARVTTKVGPVKATFNGQVTLSNINPPESYTISGEGKGGVAGFAKGGADVHLAPDGDATILTYTVNAQVGGKLAQLGSRLIDSTAKKLADQFFSSLAAKAGAASGISSAASVGAAGVDAPPPGTIEEVVQNVEHAAQEMEEEVEAKAAMGFLGGPIVWALLVILALLLVYGFAM